VLTRTSSFNGGTPGHTAGLRDDERNEGGG
jgi:hypothetical protein